MTLLTCPDCLRHSRKALKPECFGILKLPRFGTIVAHNERVNLPGTQSKGQISPSQTNFRITGLLATNKLVWSPGSLGLLPRLASPSSRNEQSQPSDRPIFMTTGMNLQVVCVGLSR